MILIAWGTRPEYFKVRPLAYALGGDCRLLFTGQHDALRNIVVDYSFMVVDGDNRLDAIVASLMDKIGVIVREEPRITHVLVQGDTTSALAMALSAYHHGLKVIHLEAGLRTYDKENPYPEEVNRRIITQIADFHLCPTYWNASNLKREGALGKVAIVGNTGLDGLRGYKKRCRYGNIVLVTLHRRENHANMEQWFEVVEQLASANQDLEFVFPIHFNPAVRKHMHLLHHVKVVEPLDRDELLELLVRSRLVITDSGGLQEECAFFHKVCLVCRKVTERPEALDASSVLVPDPNSLLLNFDWYKNNYRVTARCPFGNGDSASRVLKALKKFGIVTNLT